MIEVYDRANTDYEKNGDMTLFPESCTVTAELNGTWYMDIIHPLDKEERWKYITEESVIAAPTFMGKKQLFRVDDIEKTDTEVTAKAYPVFFDSADDCFLFDVRPTGKNGQQALNEMTAGSKYHARSNIAGGSTAYFVRRNLMDAINGKESPTFLERWGGEILYDNHTVIIDEQVGSDYGVEVRYGKNMAGIRCHIDMSGIVTRIVPVAYNGYVMTSGNFVDSPNIRKYAKIYTKEMKFENIRLAQDVEGENGADMIICADRKEMDKALEEACRQQYAAGVDLPAVTLEIDLVELSNTEEYGSFEELETIGLGDTVHCYNGNLDIYTDARAIKITWDCIYDEIQKVTLGDYEENYFRDVTSSAEKVENVVSDDGSLMAERVKGILSGMQTQLRLQNTVTRKQEVRAILFEDLDPKSEFYGALSIGSKGWEIADRRTADGRDWKWTTAATAGGIVADAVITGLLSDKKGKNFWDLDTGEFSLSSTAAIGGKTVDEIAQEKVDNQTQESVFNKLTDDGRAQGLYLKDGQLYMSFSYAKGGMLTLGGSNNTNGTLRIVDANGNQIGKWDKDGISATKGVFSGNLDAAGGTFKGDFSVKGFSEEKYPIRLKNSSDAYFGIGGTGFLVAKNGHYIMLDYDSVAVMPRLYGGTYGNIDEETYQFDWRDSDLYLDADGMFKSIWTRRHRTESDANIHISSEGYFYRVSSSSRRYKKDESTDLGEIRPESLYDLPVKTFRYKDGYLDENDSGYGKRILGFIVEDMLEVFPQAVQYEDGEPETWNSRIIIPAMLKLLQEQNERIKELEKQVL